MFPNCTEIPAVVRDSFGPNLKMLQIDSAAFAPHDGNVSSELVLNVKFANIFVEFRAIVQFVLPIPSRRFAWICPISQA